MNFSQKKISSGLLIKESEKVPKTGLPLGRVKISSRLSQCLNAKESEKVIKVALTRELKHMSLVIWKEVV